MLPNGLVSRVTFMEYDFFSQQPVKDADVYLLRCVLYDWPDKYAIKILWSLIPALSQGAKILVNEHILLQPGQAPPYQEQLFRCVSLPFQILVIRLAPHFSMSSLTI